MSEFKEVFVKNGWAYFDLNGKGIGSVIIPRKGTWYQWILLNTKDPYSDKFSGKAQGKNKAAEALIAAWEAIK